MSCKGNCCGGGCGTKSGNITMIKDGAEKTLENVSSDLSLLELAQENNIQMDTACGGNGACTTCMVKVHEGAENLSEVTDREEMMGMSSDSPDFRLGCQCKVNGGDVKVELMY